MVPAICDTIVQSSDYFKLSNEEFCERILLPMIDRLRKQQGENTDADHIHLRLSAYPTLDWMNNDYT